MNIKQLLEDFLTIAIVLSVFTNSPAQTHPGAPESASSYSTFSAPQNLGAAINSASKEQLPAIAPNGLSFYFVSERPGLGGRDIYVSQRATLSSAWGAAINMGTNLNSSSNDSIGGFSPDGREMFLESDRPGGHGAHDIYLSTRIDPNDDSEWSTPVNIGAALNTASNDYFGNYFVDPATGAGTLFFNSDRGSGSPGVNDIFQSTRNANGTFNPPVPVNELNSAASEQRSSISRDGLEFFFSSNRLGPATIYANFVSTRASVSSPWSPPVVVAILNTAGSNGQPALSPDGTVVYFASSRPGGSGDGDLYSATRVSVNRHSVADFDGDGRSDVSVFRPSEGVWYVMQSGTNTFSATPFGGMGDKIVPGDYDGDGRTDFAIYRSGTWYQRRSSDGTVAVISWGIATDKPVPGDYDGDGRTDIAVYRNGVWYIVRSSNGAFDYQFFGLSGDIPITGVNGQ